MSAGAYRIQEARRITFSFSIFILLPLSGPKKTIPRDIVFLKDNRRTEYPCPSLSAARLSLPWDPWLCVTALRQFCPFIFFIFPFSDSVHVLNRITILRISILTILVKSFHSIFLIFLQISSRRPSLFFSVTSITSTSGRSATACVNAPVFFCRTPMTRLWVSRQENNAS